MTREEVIAKLQLAARDSGTILAEPLRTTMYHAVEILHKDGQAQRAEVDASDWISVEDGLPKNGGDYLVYAEASIQIAEYFNVTRSWVDENMETIKPTHWQDLPSGPSKP